MVTKYNLFSLGLYRYTSMLISVLLYYFQNKDPPSVYIDTPQCLYQYCYTIFKTKTHPSVYIDPPQCLYRYTSVFISVLLYYFQNKDPPQCLYTVGKNT